MVVAIHARAYVNLSADAEEIIKPIVTLIAVPVFFLCDGFLFVHGRMLKRHFDYRRYLINSARRLLIPWVLFSLFYLVLRWASEVTRGRTSGDQAAFGQVESRSGERDHAIDDRRKW